MHNDFPLLIFAIFTGLVLACALALAVEVGFRDIKRRKAKRIAKNGHRIFLKSAGVDCSRGNRFCYLGLPRPSHARRSAMVVRQTKS